MIKISYILISHNGLAFLQQLLPSLKQQMQRKDVEIILVDNGSTDGTTKYISTQYVSIQLIPLSDNKGVAYARNRALEKAKGQYLFILDNDTIVNDIAVEGMEKHLDTHTKTGLVACQLQDLNGSIQNTYLPYPGILVKLARLFNVPFPSMQPIYVIGACQMIRRKAFEQVGFLDEAIFYGPEDCDFCLRLQDAGWSVEYLPQFTIIHACQRITHHHIFSSLTREHIRGLIYFYSKHKRWW